ncbi:MAG: Rpn family recombination-promoting nuclease/putative transposase [Clostridia bacterium]|nr:Rpn family recombination-promoting nuclease/putative transposase [Clostridia bacterium]
MLPEIINQKLGILDVKAELLDGTTVDIEMQNVNYHDIEKRMTYYLNQLYVGELAKGKMYNELNKAIAIGILNFDYFKDIEEYHTIWKMTEQHDKTKTIEEQEMHFIELPKFLRSNLNTDRKIDQWLLFIEYSRKELLKMVEDKNEMIKEAVEEYEYLKGDEEVQRIAFLRRKYELDHNNALYHAQKQGEAIGEKRGEKAKQIEIARKMKTKGMEIDIIAELTGLTKEEIESL